MQRLFAKSDCAVEAYALIRSLQQRFISALEAWNGAVFVRTEWFRDEGRHGGGIRFGTGDTQRLGRASVNVSQVQYEGERSYPLNSASAVSAIVHPAHPRMPSIHIHISWTEVKDLPGYWRIMADLNPAIPDPQHAARFSEALQAAAPRQFSEAKAQGERYFYIPALKRHRGAVHFYLEQYHSGNDLADLELAGRVGEAAAGTYMSLLHDTCPPVSEADLARQLEYHTLYFFQVLTLDRGTTAGLLVHDQNDVGILGSLPPRIDRKLLASWRSLLPAPQDQLLEGILSVLPAGSLRPITDDIKVRLAEILRLHYRCHPEALKLQASGFAVPPPILNHRPKGLHGTWPPDGA